jgi:hypothetical protein
LVDAAPTEQCSPVSAKTRSRSRVPISQGVPSRRRAPATSKNASSILSGSTKGVTSPSSPMTRFEKYVYRSKCGSNTIACGQRRSAIDIGIAEFTPYFRAS